MTWRDRLAEGGVQCLAKSATGKDHYWRRSAERERERERERENKYNKIMTREGKRKKKLNSFSICVSTIPN